MLEPEYKRDMHKQYIVLKERCESREESYGMKMVANNRIPGVLEIEARYVDRTREYYYNVTEKQPMNVLFRKETLKEEQIRNILTEVIRTLRQGREYLLMENNFVLEPEYIYMDLEGKKPELLYFSGHEGRISEQLLRLIEYMMDKVDYKDKQAVYLIYGIYKISREASCTFDRLLEFLEDGRELEKELSRREAEEKESWKEEEKILYMETEIESEEEKRKYPLWVWIGAAASVVVSLVLIVVAVKSGLMFDMATGKVLLGKMAAVFGLVGALEAYCLLRILDEKNQVAYIAKRTDYIKPIEEKRKWEENKKEQKQECLAPEIWEEREKEREKGRNARKEGSAERTGQETVVLAERNDRYFLAPKEPDIYMPIFFPEFPFFIGTLKTKVDHVIASRNVSRFHAKFERENEKFYLVDLNSTNGTFLNGARLTANERKEVALGDFVSFADVAYQFRRE